MVKLAFRVHRKDIPHFSEYLKKQGINRYEVFEETEEEISSVDRLEEFLAIPEEYRINPYEYSPSGDLYFADKRNIDKLNQSIESAENSQKIMINPDDLWGNIK